MNKNSLANHLASLQYSFSFTEQHNEKAVQGQNRSFFRGEAEKRQKHYKHYR